MKHEEAQLLNAVANGMHTLEELCLGLEKNPSQLSNLLQSMLAKKLIVVNNYSFLISKRGLLELSRFIFFQKCKKAQYSYSYANGMPYLPYANNFKKDTIFHPDLFFQPASPHENWDTQTVYEIEFERYKLDIDLLEVIGNLLFEYEHWQTNGFWTLRCREKSVCGHGIASLRRTLELVEETSGLLFVAGFQNFVVIVKSRGKGVRDNLQARIYLTKANFPYVDTIDSIYEILRILWLFLGITSLPQGYEIEIRSRNSVILSEKPLFFVPEVLGTINWIDKTRKVREVYPYVLAFNSSNLKSDLSKVNPWLATCSGGFLDDDFSAKRKFSLSLFRIVRLPQVNLVTAIIHAKARAKHTLSMRDFS